MTRPALPPERPTDRFFDLEGIPISRTFSLAGGHFCAAWDTDPPRRFDPDSADRNGSAISRAEFIRLAGLKA